MLSKTFKNVKVLLEDMPQPNNFDLMIITEYGES